MNAWLVQELDRRTDGPGCVHNLLELTDSPIEAVLLLALVLCARDHGLDIRIDGQDPTSDYPFYTHYDGDPNRQLLIQPQARIGDYRVDFLLSFDAMERTQKNTISDGADPQWLDVHVEKKLIIECDGHDYHERTKEQARKDKSRDRKLQSLGFPVYRYTGSELFQDPFACAAQVLHVVSGCTLHDDDNGG